MRTITAIAANYCPERRHYYVLCSNMICRPLNSVRVKFVLALRLKFINTKKKYNRKYNKITKMLNKFHVRRILNSIESIWRGKNTDNKNLEVSGVRKIRINTPAWPSKHS